MDRRTLLAILIVGAIILLTPYYYKWISPPVEETPGDARQEAPAEVAEQPVEQDVPRETTALDPEQPPLEENLYADTGLDTSYVPEDESLARADSVIVETPLYRAVFSTRGASVQSWVLKPVQPYLHEPEQLVRQEYAHQNLVLIARGGGGLLRTENRIFEASRSRITLHEGSSAETVIFSLDLGGGGIYRQKYTFYPDRYVVDITLDGNRLGNLTGAAHASFGWGGGLSLTETDTSQDLYYTQSNFLMGSSLEKLKGNGKKVEEEEATGPTRWVAQRTKYFLMALVPRQPAIGARLYTWPDSLYFGSHRPKLYDTSMMLNMASGDLYKEMQLYLGPLDQNLVKQVDPTLEKTMSWGWSIIQPFSKGVFHALVFLHRFIPNYGLVLILFALLVKIIVWPLTHKSYKSMKRMQMLQPKLKELQAKYKDNPQKMQQEVMGLYKQYKVNPMGGCWPMLLQMPLLYGLFIIFRSTIELRGQPFVLWISDLSMPDALINLPFTIPLYGDHIAILPLVMAVTTYLQSKQTVTDPNQKVMLYMMPAMFIFLFNNFPSGLTLYYTLFNITSWAQQKLMKIEDPQLEKVIEESREEAEKQAMREERKKRKQNRDNS